MDASRAAEFLADHRRTGEIMADLPPELRPANLGESYAIQDALVDRLRDGKAIIGYKVACTNTIAQQALQIDRPVFGRLLELSTFPSPAHLHRSDFTTRVVEAEFGIRMGADVPKGNGHRHNAASIRDYIGEVIPSIEIVNHRFVDWSVGALSVAADNAIHGCWVPGAAYPGDWRVLDLASHEVTVRVDGALQTVGRGDAVLGDPLNVVAWLAEELERYGRQLKAGDLITTGVCTDVFTADKPCDITADFGVLGSVSINWS